MRTLIAAIHYLLKLGRAIRAMLSGLSTRAETERRVAVEREVVKANLDRDAARAESEIAEKVKHVADAETDAEFVERWKRAQRDETKNE